MAKAKRHGLKAALHRARATSESKAAARRKDNENNPYNRAAKPKHVAPPKPPSKPWAADNLIVLIGEGDFGFAKSIVDSCLCDYVIATGLDSREEVEKKYQAKAVDNLKFLESDPRVLGILTEIDATKLSKFKKLRQLLMNRERKQKVVFVFNFPHLGNSVSDKDRNIVQHQSLMLSFFHEAKSLVQPCDIVVSLFEGEPYNSWGLKRLAREQGLKLRYSTRFAWDLYEGYQHQLTNKGNASTSKPQLQRPARSYVFTTEGQLLAGKAKHTESDSE